MERQEAKKRGDTTYFLLAGHALGAMLPTEELIIILARSAPMRLQVNFIRTGYIIGPRKDRLG